MSACTMSSCGLCGSCSSSWDREADDAEVCPDCLGSGEVIREDGSDYQRVATCLECDGKGWIE